MRHKRTHLIIGTTGYAFEQGSSILCIHYPSPTKSLWNYGQCARDSARVDR